MSSAGMPHISAAFPPLTTSLKEGRSSLMGRSGTRISTPLASRLSVGGSAWYNFSKYLAHCVHTPMRSKMIWSFTDEIAVVYQESLEFS